MKGCRAADLSFTVLSVLMGFGVPSMIVDGRRDEGAF
jgi:hypothetical protein